MAILQGPSEHQMKLTQLLPSLEFECFHGELKRFFAEKLLLLVTEKVILKNILFIYF